MFGLFKKKFELLRVEVDGRAACTVGVDDIPCEKLVTVDVGPSTIVEFIEPDRSHRHRVDGSAGWLHLSVRVHANRACQADCAISSRREFDPQDLRSGDASGVRFQPFLLSGSSVSKDSLRGRGLFARGLHFAGNVTPGNVSLSCECDECGETFSVRSFHAGFSDCGYFYSGSGAYTLTVSNREPGSPSALSQPDPDTLAELEARLPIAADGSRYAYLNPFRCPHCRAAYIDFGRFPEQRPGEYYGLYFPEHPPERLSD